MKKNLKRNLENKALSPHPSNVESMTGIGESYITFPEYDHIRFYCRVKSVNHRFLESKIRTPKFDSFDFDMQVKRLLQSHFKRGSFEIFFGIENISSNKQKSKSEILNLIWLEALSSEIKDNRNKLNKLGFQFKKISFETILNIPSALNNNKQDLDLQFIDNTNPDVLSKCWLKAAENAFTLLKNDRRREGHSLQKHFLSLINSIDLEFKEIIKLEPIEKENSIRFYKEKASKTLSFLLDHSSSHSPEFEKRLKEEAVFWIERRDFEEERVRFGNHLNHLRSLFEHNDNSEHSLGKLLEFKHQEILREINTLGNKAQSIEVAKHVVQIKTLIERMKEQISNVE